MSASSIANSRNPIQNKIIKVKGYEWEKELLVTGHYQFEIEIFSNDNTGNDIFTIFRRFSQIEWLQEGWLKLNPGCRIPQLPEKSLWCNLSVNNSLELEKRKQQIEIYLNYLYSHKFLSTNEYFVYFISKDFNVKTIGQAQTETKSTGIFNKMYSWTNYIPYINAGGPWNNKVKYDDNTNIIEDNSILTLERSNWERCLTGWTDLIGNIKTNNSINEDKTKAIGKIIQINEEMKNFSLDYRIGSTNRTVEENSNFNESSNDDNNINANTYLHSMNNFYEKKRTYQKNLATTIIEELSSYKQEIVELIEGYNRKAEIEVKYKQRNSDSYTMKDKEKYAYITKEFLDKLNEEWLYEVNKFKSTREGDLLWILKKFYKDKYELALEINNILITTNQLINKTV